MQLNHKSEHRREHLRVALEITARALVEGACLFWGYREIHVIAAGCAIELIFLILRP